MIFLKTGIQTQFRNGIFTLTSTAKPAHSAAILVINAKSFSFCSWLLGEISCSDASVPFIRCGRVSHTTTNRLPGKENTMKCESFCRNNSASRKRPGDGAAWPTFDAWVLHSCAYSNDIRSVLPKHGQTSTKLSTIETNIYNLHTSASGSSK